MPKILIADDDSDILMLIGSRLRANGMETIEVSDCNQAIKMAYAEQPDLILMDIRMPKIGGVKAFDCLKMYSTTERIPVIFITAHYDSDTRTKAVESGAVDCLYKPFDDDQFLDAVQKAIDQADKGI